jgi:H+/Cl- antiporter ClcA
VVLTVYYGPYAAGSGVPEVMGMLNGVNGGGAVYVASLITKAVGVTFAVLGNLCVGKEGPLVHIGSICGLLCPYMPFEIFRCFHNDSDKRTFMSAGCSAGVAAAFGAPIGGTLFTYEISKPTTFWTFSMLWRVFFSAAMSCFTLGILQSLKTGSVLSLSNSATLKFGEVNIMYSPLSDAVVAVILGIICGLLGALFVSVYSILGVYRKKYVNTNLKKVLEVLVLSLATSSVFFWLSASNASNPANCISLSTAAAEETYAFTCPEGTFNTQTTLFFNTEGGVIRSLMNQMISENWKATGLFTLTWYFFMVVTAGSQTPGGLFVPAMIIGCAIGSLLNAGRKGFFDKDNPVTGQSYEIMGCAAMLAGFTR